MPQRIPHRGFSGAERSRAVSCVNSRAQPTPMSDSRTLTRHQAASVLNVSVKSVDRAISRGTLRAVRIGRLVRIPRDALDELLQGGAA